MINTILLKHSLHAGFIALGLTLALGSFPASAVPLPNVDPATFADDLDEGGLFLPTSPTFAIELFDFAGDAGAGAEFGFYFFRSDVSDPLNLITIFDTGDHGTSAAALIDFTAGAVVDTDDGDSVQSIFTPTGGPIGFYLSISGTTLFSEPGENGGGVDLMGTFPVLADPALLVLGFAVPAAAGGIEYVAFELLANIVPTAVPAPGALALVAMGLLLTGASRRPKHSLIGRIKKIRSGIK